MIKGIHDDKFSELTLFRRQYLNSPLIRNMETVIKALGERDGDQLVPSYEYKDDQIRMTASNSCHIRRVDIFTPQHGSILVFCDEYYYSPNTKNVDRDDPYHSGRSNIWTITIDDVTYRPGKWIDYVNNVLLPRAHTKIAAEKALDAKRTQEQQSIASQKHQPIDDSVIFD